MPVHSRLIAISQPLAPATEAFRQLRTSVLSYSGDRPLQTIMVTSPMAQEGKTSVVANLAITLAQAGRTVILVDADLRQPSLHTLFDVPGGRGLTSALLEPVGELPLQATGVDNLRLLAGGPHAPNPSELLASPRMAEVIAELRGQAAFVLFDASLIVAVTDAAVLAPLVDGVLLVLQSAKSRRDLAERAKDQLERVHANVLGVVLTDVPGAGTPRSYGTSLTNPA